MDFQSPHLHKSPTSTVSSIHISARQKSSSILQARLRHLSFVAVVHPAISPARLRFNKCLSWQHSRAVYAWEMHTLYVH